MVDLYKKHIWDDQKTVNVIAEACLLESPKIVATALNFFLGSNEEEIEEDQDDAVSNLKQSKYAMTMNKKTRSRKAQLEKITKNVKRVRGLKAPT